MDLQNSKAPPFLAQRPSSRFVSSKHRMWPLNYAMPQTALLTWTTILLKNEACTVFEFEKRYIG